MNRSSALLGLLAVVVGVCAAAERKAPPWEKRSRNAALHLYRDNCVVCHDIDSAETRKMAPSLFRFFQNEKTPLTAVEPSEQYFRVKVQFGGDIMPAFQGKITDKQLDMIVEFVRSKKQ